MAQCFCVSGKKCFCSEAFDHKTL